LRISNIPSPPKHLTAETAESANPAASRPDDDDEGFTDGGGKSGTLARPTAHHEATKSRKFAKHSDLLREKDFVFFVPFVLRDEPFYFFVSS
jgi:hypothetical protein